MGAYLIIGPSGSGKTTIGIELSKRGYKVIETDEAFGYYADLKTERPVDYPGVENLTEDWYKFNGWIWNRRKVEEEFNNLKGPIFFCGGAANESEFYKRFLKIFFLYADRKTLINRLENRELNSETNNPLYIQMMLQYLENYSHNVEFSNMIVIDATNNAIKSATNLIIRCIENPVISFLRMANYKTKVLIKKTKQSFIASLKFNMIK